MQALRLERAHEKFDRSREPSGPFIGLPDLPAMSASLQIFDDTDEVVRVRGGLLDQPGCR